MWPVHYLLQFGGTRGAPGVELWICGIRLCAKEPEVTQRLNATSPIQLVELTAAVQAWWQRPTSRIAATAGLKFVKFGLVGTNGRYVDGRPESITFPTPLPGGAVAAGTNPWQVSVKHTFRSDQRTRGPASKGGIYSPAPTSAPVVATGLFSASHALDMANSMKTLLQAIDIDQLGKPHIYPSIVSDVGSGSASRVTEVTVDNRFDVLRRRANRQQPVTSHASVGYFPS